jgi:hypothetical protein
MDRNELREAILGADDLPTEIVDVPEWDTKVHVRGLTASERDAYISEVVNPETGQMRWKNASALLVCRTLVDEDGARVFTDSDASDLGDKSSAALSRLFNTAMRLSGLTQADVEEATQTFETAQTGGSSSE